MKNLNHTVTRLFGTLHISPIDIRIVTHAGLEHEDLPDEAGKRSTPHRTPDQSPGATPSMLIHMCYNDATQATGV
ncbi:hypothetical protein E4U15_004334 [Claviceps sp. LM218 group G6]|nr:hypothetical protein E4U15_004334 [Claviceps sp. LM218 group G6]